MHFTVLFLIIRAPKFLLIFAPYYVHNSNIAGLTQLEDISMINSTNTLNIDGTKLNNEEINRILDFDKQDTFTRWVVRPIAALTVVGLMVAGFFASAFFIAISLALVPFIALSAWALKKKMERDAAAADPVVDTQSDSRVDATETAATEAN